MPEVNSESPAIKDLCEQISAEENPSKIQHLVNSLRNSVEVERDETRLRLRLIAQQYRQRIRSAPLRTKMLDVLNFLGLVPAQRPTEDN
jgi:hypothetical protein